MASCKTAKTQMFLNFKGGTGQALEEEVKIPFKIESSHIIEVQVGINGSIFPMVLDTGGLTMVDNEVGDSLKLEVISEPHPGTKLSKISDITLGDVTVNDLNTFIMGFKNKFEFEHYGMIGSDFLRFFQTEYNYQKQTITFRNPKKTQEKTDKDHLMKMEIIFPYFPTIDVNFGEGKSLPGMVDTGLHYAFVMPISCLEYLTEEQKTDLIEAEGFFAKWPTPEPPQNYLYQFDEFRIGDIVLNKVPILFAVLPDFLQQDVILIGKYFLENYITTLDYMNKQVMFSEVGSNSYDLAFSTGIMISLKEEKFIVRGIWKDSPAYKQGISTETELFAINGKNHKQISHEEIMDLLMIRNITEINLTILRDGKEEEILLKKRNLFE